MNVNIEDNIYFQGTVYEASYKCDSGVETHQSILAVSFEEGFVFQVVQINEYYAGEIEFMIPRQFEHVNAVTYSFLLNELTKRAHGEVSDLKIITDQHCETIKDYLDSQREIGLFDNPLTPYKA